MAGKLQFSLVSPEREVFSGLVDQVDAPGVEGDFGVLADHAPFMTALREGVVTVIDGNARRQFDVHGGFADVTPRIVTLVMRFAGGTPFVRMNSMALVGMSEGAMTLAEEERNRLVETIAAESASVVERYRDGQGLAFELRCIVREQMLAFITAHYPHGLPRLRSTHDPIELHAMQAQNDSVSLHKA